MCAPAGPNEHSGSDSEANTPLIMRQIIPDFRKDVATKYVKMGYRKLCRSAWTFPIFVSVVAIGAKLALMAESGELGNLWATAAKTHVESSMFYTIGYTAAFAFGLAAYIFARKSPVYLVDFSVLAPPKDWRINVNTLVEVAKNGLKDNPDKESLIDFQLKIEKNSGITSDGTYLPPGITDFKNQKPTMETARKEAEVVLFTLVEDVLAKTKLKPKDIDILILNCGVFNATPSLSAMVVNKFKMRSNIQSYNLGGMGCSAGVIAVNLAKDLLQYHRNANALVITTELITKQYYKGNQKGMMIPNMLFRVGGAASIMSNKRKDYWRAKYQLMHTVRTHRGADDTAYKCVYQKEDVNGVLGVKLEKTLFNVAGDALKVNITTLGPLVLPVSEQLKFFWNLVARKVFKMKMKAYIPDFKKAFDHFCIHTGGRGVLDALQENLKLTDDLMTPSRQSLYHFGNTSSSSVWYELAWAETNGRVLSGDRIWQIAFGSGFKCNSAVWHALRTNDKPHQAWLKP